MKKNKWIVCIFTVMSTFLLFINCNKSQVAQVDFSVKLASTKSYFSGLIGTDSTKAFPIEITIRATSKVAALYPKAKFYLKYTILDKEGNKRSDNLYFVDTKTSSNRPIPIPLPSDSFRNIPYRFISNVINKDYNVLGTTNTFLSKPYYKILFTLVVKDSIDNELMDLPTVTPKEAHRTFEVIIDSTNTNEASYLLSLEYNKNSIFSKKNLNNHLYSSFVKTRIFKDHIG